MLLCKDKLKQWVKSTRSNVLLETLTPLLVCSVDLSSLLSFLFISLTKIGVVLLLFCCCSAVLVCLRVLCRAWAAAVWLRRGWKRNAGPRRELKRGLEERGWAVQGCRYPKENNGLHGKQWDAEVRRPASGSGAYFRGELSCLLRLDQCATEKTQQQQRQNRRQLNNPFWEKRNAWKADEVLDWRLKIEEDGYTKLYGVNFIFDYRHVCTTILLLYYYRYFILKYWNEILEYWNISFYAGCLQKVQKHYKERIGQKRCWWILIIHWFLLIYIIHYFCFAYIWLLYIMTFTSVLQWWYAHS